MINRTPMVVFFLSMKKGNQAETWVVRTR